MTGLETSDALYEVCTENIKDAIEYAIEALYAACLPLKKLPLIDHNKSEEEQTRLAEKYEMRKRLTVARMGLLSVMEELNARDFE